MPYHTPINLPSGAILQAGIPKEAAAPPGPFNTLVRAVVTAVYVTDDPQHPLAKAGVTPTSVYVDLLVYGSMSGGSRFFFLPGAAVLQPYGGLHGGAIYKPRATSRLVSGRPLSDLTPNDVGEMDGDHVLVCLADGRSNQAIVIGHLPHPSRDVGNPADLPLGQRQQLRLADGDALFLAHHGSVFGLDDAGNFVVDTTRGTQNGLLPNSGEAPGSPGNGSFIWALAGAAMRTTTFGTTTQAVLQEQLSAAGYTLDSKALPMAWQLKSSAGNGLRLLGGGGGATLQLGDGSQHAAVAEQLQALWGALQGWAASHVHPQSGPIPGMTGPSSVPAPGYNSSVTSQSLSLPK